MKSRCLTLAGLCLLIAACGRTSSPNTPTPVASPATPISFGSGSGSVAATALNTPFAFDLGKLLSSPPATSASQDAFSRCLSGSATASCRSGALATTIHASAVAPGAPTALTSTVSGSFVTLIWSPPSSGDPVSSYIIEAGSAPGLSNLAYVATNSTATTFSAGGVGAGSYYVRVRAQNAGGTSTASNEILLIVGSAGCTGAPGAPSGLTSSVSGSSVTLAWTASAGSPSSYVVEAGSSSGAANLANSDLGTTATAYTATGVGAGTYYVRLRARNACGTSAASNEVVVVVGSSSVVITAWGARLSVTVIGGSYVTSGQIDLTVNTPLSGLYRAEFNSYGNVGAQQRFIAPTRNLSFFPYVITPACPDLHGTVPIYLYDDGRGGIFVGSIAAELHGSGCAFNP